MLGSNRCHLTARVHVIGPIQTDSPNNSDRHNNITQLRDTAEFQRVELRNNKLAGRKC